MKDMPKHNQIKYRQKRSKGKWKYGLFDHFGIESAKLWKNGKVIIGNAVLPFSTVYQYEDLEIIDIAYVTPKWNKETNDFTLGDEFAEYINNEFIKARSKSKKAKGLVGKMFSVNVADGYADYIITKENKKTVKVEWRGFSLDRYIDQMIGWEGLMDKDRAIKMVQTEESRLSLGPIFGV